MNDLFGRVTCRSTPEDGSETSSPKKDVSKEEGPSDDEMEPLRDALERAKVKAGKSAFKREALEAEVGLPNPQT